METKKYHFYILLLNFLNKKNLFSLNKIIYVVGFFGAFLRIFHYLDNRSIWRDEAYLALNLLDKNYYQLSQLPLDYNQHAPIGFLLLEKTFGLLFSYQEPALRLLPLFSGLLSLYLFIIISLKLFKRKGALLAAICFSFAHPIIYQSVEIKQYSTELLIALAVFYFWLKITNLESKKLIYFGIASSIGLWFSYSLLFILLGLFLASFYKIIKKNSYKNIKNLIFVSFFVLGSFLLHYYFFISKSYSPSIVNFWRPLFLSSSHGIQIPFWFVKMFFYAFDDPLGLNLQIFSSSSLFLRFSLPALIFLFIGIYNFWRNDKVILIAFISPVFLMIFFCAIEKFVPYQRLILFYSPFVFWIIASGFESLIDSKKLVTYFLASLLTILTVSNSLQQLIYPDYFGGFRRNEFRQALFSQLSEGNKKSVLIDEFYFASFRFYSKAYNLKVKAQEISVPNFFENKTLGEEIIIYCPTLSKYIDEDVKKSMKIKNLQIIKIINDNDLEVEYKGLDVIILKPKNLK